jgi:hypothetical protein
MRKTSELRSDGRASLAWQAKACPTHAAQPPGNGQVRAALGWASYARLAS